MSQVKTPPRRTGNIPVEVRLKPEFNDAEAPRAGSCSTARACPGHPGKVRACRLYEITGPLSAIQQTAAGKGLLCDAVTQEFRAGDLARLRRSTA